MSLEKKTFRIAVSDLIQVSCKKGNLSNTYTSRQRALAGIREHIRVQNLRPENYRKEVPVSLLIEDKDFNLEIFGRIDGIFESKNNIVLEEIKSCQKDPVILSSYPEELHIAQLKCYGFIYLKENNLESIFLQLTYANILTKEIAENKKLYSKKDLFSFFSNIADNYITGLKDQTKWKSIRDKSIENLPFPYEDFRKGQRDLSVSVYRTIHNKRILFARAPTGTGKTIATLFPAVKAIGKKLTDKIFYLTAKTVGREVVKKAVYDMQNKGLRLKSVFLTAKQKICFVSNETCDMDLCPYANQYYHKLNKAINEFYKYDIFDRPLIEDLARKFEICPFELSLDISLLCDLIVCDLNYVFDPRVYLKRYFEMNPDQFTFLIDESHNLPDRLRSMYSAQLFKQDILDVKRVVKDEIPSIESTLTRINTLMLDMRKDCEARNKKSLSFTEIPGDFLSAIKDFYTKADLWLDQNKESHVKSVLLDLFFSANIFLTISEYFDSNYTFFIEKVSKNNLMVNLYCLDPSPVFSQLIKRSSSSVFFSATFFPFQYYKSILFEKEIETDSILLPSSFPPDNLKILIHNNIATTYRLRDRSYKDIATLIKKTVLIKKGNYIIYFPSYEYMNNVLEIIHENDDINSIIAQEPDMSEEQREAFLSQFTNKSNITAFAIMGGIFGEGIDLEGKKLIGVIIIGVGIPLICPERDLLKEYYDMNSKQAGFFYSYLMPGFSRVLQASGRVIRTQDDKGVVILVDERFAKTDYKNLFPLEWQSPIFIKNFNMLEYELSSFWNKRSE